MSPVNRLFARDEILPSYLINRIQDQLSGLAPNLRVTKLSNTSVRIPAGTDDDLVAISIDGKWRFVTANVDRNVPAGAATTYDVFACAADNSISNSPLPNTDNTNYAFVLRIVAGGTTPAVEAGVVEIWRKIGEIVWDGSKITRIRQLVHDRRVVDTGWGAITGATLRRSLASSYTIDQLRDVLYTIVDVLTDEGRLSA